MTKIKICGLRTTEDIHMANRLKPDYIGFVFAGKKRKITPEQAEEMKALLVEDIKSVGVFVNEKIDRVAFLANRGILDMIQLHGEEDADYIKKLRSLTDKPLIKAVRVRSREDILRAQELDAEYLLLDSYKAGEAGGSGETFAWEMIPKLEKPWFLAGGLSEDNVRYAIEQCTPWAVDISSAVETAGYKDERKVKNFIDKVRRKDE